ncbi:MAG: TetR/AcrR family transcriptional regulator [Gammaproteobacteria bacterium]|nr:TetR/AcrR family transcriptional regulator [Gammaproteobacteria bacterium]
MPRKPRQKRSRATVDAIIEAGFICVAEKGTDDTTTRHIADKAGISVGSLYEYFTNKEAIYDAMNQRFVEEVVAMIQPMMADLVRMKITEMIQTLLKSFEILLRRNDDRYLKCVRHAMRVDIKDYMGPITKILAELVMQHLMHHPENMRVRNIPTMTYIFINGGIFAVVRHLSDPNPPISFDELAQGLSDMVGHYVSQERQLMERAESKMGQL